MLGNWLKACLTTLIFAAIMVPATPQELTIAAAADLRAALDEIATHFQAQSAVKVKVIYGSSGNFYEQLHNGAPFDVFLSANADYPRKLDSAGLAVPGSYYEYAQGKLVLLVPADSKLDLHKGLQLLLDPAVKKLSIADPNHAPYGQAAVAALNGGNLYDKVSAKIVTGENVSQAASFVLSGAADVGLVAMSLALSPSIKSQVRYAEVPASDYPPIRQACIVLRSSKSQKAAMQFEEYLRSEEAKAVLREYGFEVLSQKTL
jgi:molybdate transport system substrate-binding protein